MKKEIEITIKPLISYKEIDEILSNEGFNITEKYYLNDIYMIPKNVDIFEEQNLEVLKKCILIRDINGEVKQLVYKYKEYANNGDIITQGKTRCNVYDIEEAKTFLESIGYIKLFEIHNNSVVYNKDGFSICVQMIKDQGIYIELEAEDKDGYRTIEDLIEYINKLKIPKENNYFVKKAEAALIILKNKIQ